MAALCFNFNAIPRQEVEYIQSGVSSTEEVLPRYVANVTHMCGFRATLGSVLDQLCNREPRTLAAHLPGHHRKASGMSYVRDHPISISGKWTSVSEEEFARTRLNSSLGLRNSTPCTPTGPSDTYKVSLEFLCRCHAVRDFLLDALCSTQTLEMWPSPNTPLKNFNIVDAMLDLLPYAACTRVRNIRCLFYGTFYLLFSVQTHAKDRLLTQLCIVVLRDVLALDANVQGVCCIGCNGGRRTVEICT
ncbi:hypothetical protein B0H19DRAFT_1084425 [Mycena capillaripes]|nr:hypothetical protein B0H19DRAFT_1084425 [Mycena capillaripes]